MTDLRARAWYAACYRASDPGKMSRWLSCSWTPCAGVCLSLGTSQNYQSTAHDQDGAWTEPHIAPWNESEWEVVGFEYTGAVGGIAKVGTQPCFPFSSRLVLAHMQGYSDPAFVPSSDTTCVTPVPFVDLSTQPPGPNCSVQTAHQAQFLLVIKPTVYLSTPARASPFGPPQLKTPPHSSNYGALSDAPGTSGKRLCSCQTEQNLR